MEKLYYSLVKNEKNKETDINIFGDITSYDWCESDMSAFKLSKIIQEMKDVETINVHISSYGGEVKEGLAIYNVLKNHKAKIKTYADGFACSIASIIFMAGDVRIMNKSSLLMIHNAWMSTSGNASDLRKQADDLDKITRASINIYMENINISEDKLKRMLDEEYWLDYQEALNYGFATSIQSEEKSNRASQLVKQSLKKIILQSQKNKEAKEMDKQLKCNNCGYIYEGAELPEYFVCPECGADKESFENIITQNDTEPEKLIVGYKCLKCDYVYEGSELPKYFVCPECGTDKESFEEIIEEQTDGENKNNEESTKEAVDFFNAMIGGMK